MTNPHDPVNINGNWWHYDATTRTHRPAGDRAAGQAANMERPAGRKPKGPRHGAASTIQAMLLDRENYASLADIAECYRHYCEEFAASGWLELSYWDETDDHIGPVDYIAARVTK